MGTSEREQKQGLFARFFRRREASGSRDLPPTGPQIAISVEDFKEKYRAAIRPAKNKTEDDRPVNPQVSITEVIDPKNNRVIGHNLEIVANNKPNTRTFVALTIPLEEDSSDTEDLAAKRRLVTQILVADSLHDVVNHAWVMKPNAPARLDPNNASASFYTLTQRGELMATELTGIMPYVIPGVVSTQPPPQRAA